MSTPHTRTPRLSAFLALFYIFIVFRSSETLCYIALVAFFFLIWLHNDGESRLVRQREENRRALVRESLEFRRILPYGEQQEELVACERKNDCDCESDALILSDIENAKPVPIGNQECCSICLEPYAVGDGVARVKNMDNNNQRRQCHHWFHEVCILKWLQHRNQCPLCRVEMICDDQRDKIETRQPGYGTYSPSNVTVV